MKRCLLLAVSAQLVLSLPVLAADTDANKSDAKSKKVVTTTTTTVRKTRSGLVPPPPPNSSMISKPYGFAPKTAAVAPAASPQSTTVVVGSGGPYTFNGSNNQQFSGIFDWSPSDSKDPLTMNIDSAGPSAGTMSFRWVKIYLGNRLLATEKDFRGKTSLQLDLSGTVASGRQQMIIRGEGYRGATIRWNLSTEQKVKLSSAEPNEVCPDDTVTLNGENFSAVPDENIVTLGKTVITVKSASPTQLKITIPTKRMEFGELDATVKVGSIKSNAVKITVRGIPELSGTNFNGIPPGAELYIFGKNFSKKLSENQVFFGETSAPVVRGTTDELVVIVPNFYNGAGSGSISGQVGIPIKVRVGRIESKNTVPITIGNSMWQSPGFRGGEDTPVVPVGF